MNPLPRTGSRSRVALPVVLVLHALLFWGLGLALQRPPTPAPAERPGLLWLLDRPTAPLATATPVPTARPTRVPDPRRALPRGQAQAITLPAPAGVSPVPAPPAPAPPVNAAEVVSPAASQATTLLLDAPATRRAIRDAARAETLSERAARATDAPPRPDATERLGQDIAKGALGDCLKGEYAGGGMGILSLPFFVAAELRGKCRR